MELIEAFDDLEYEDIYTDMYIYVKNLQDFYNVEVDSRATDLLESFLLETLVQLKQNPEVTLVISSPSHVKAIAFTPEGESAAYLLDDAVTINSMLEIYNDALAQNSMPQIEIGIGLASYQSDIHECHSNCECNHEEDSQSECHHDCECEHEHGISKSLDNQNNLAEYLANVANNGELDPIVINEGFYGLISDLETEKSFIDQNFQRFTIESDDLIVFHGNIVLEE
jgi:hypothetical protein